MTESRFLLETKEPPERIGEKVSLQEELCFVERELRLAEDLFNNVTEVSLIDAASYRIKALGSYREYLLRTARAEGILLSAAK